MKKLTGLTVAQVIAKLNESVQRFVGTKVGDIHCPDMGAFHVEIEYAIKNNFAEDGIEYLTWYVTGKPMGVEYKHFVLRVKKDEVNGVVEILSLKFEPVMERLVKDYPNIKYQRYANYVENEVRLESISTQIENLITLKGEYMEKGAKMHELIKADEAEALAAQAERV